MRMYAKTGTSFPCGVVAAVIFIVVIWMLVVPARTDDSSGGQSNLFKSDLCQDDGFNLQCGDHQLIRIRQIACGDRSRACAPTVNQTVFRLCDGERRCFGLGLRNILGVYCFSPVMHSRHVVVEFACQMDPHTPDPPCRTNICSNTSLGLSCPGDSVVHVRSLACLSDVGSCSWATYTMLYTLCEGQQECESSGLRMLMPQYCDNPVPHLRNVFVDYLCVPKNLTWSKCNGQHKALQEPFGLLMNPGFLGRTSDVSTNQQCNWILASSEAQEIRVIVHVAESRRGTANCTPSSFLQVQSRDCRTRASVTSPYCYLRDVSPTIRSCGPVKVSGWLSDTSAQTDRFLISYQIVPEGSGDVIPGNMSECSTPLVTSTPIPTTTATTTTIRPTVAIARNYGPGGTMFDYSDTIRQTGDDAKTDGEEHSAFQFKLVILYVFFAVVIIALVIALVYVLVSYRGISRRGRCTGDSSEKAALWRHDDTPLDTFNHNSHASLAEVTTSPTNTPNSPRDSQVVATVHAESTDEDESRFSSGSGFSSFLPGKDTDFKELLASLNPYATVGNNTPDGRGGANTLPRRYSGGNAGSNRNSRRSNSLKMNGDLGDIYETIDTHQYNRQQPPQQQPHYDYHNGQADGRVGREEEEQQVPLVQPPSPGRAPSPPLPPPPPSIAMDYVSDSEPVDHYTVNNDEYALVRKHKNKPALQQVQPGLPSSRSGDYTNLPCLIQERNGVAEDDSDPTYDSVEFKVSQDSAPVVNFRPTSGPYDRDRNSKADHNVSPSSGGSRHRWDEDL